MELFYAFIIMAFLFAYVYSVMRKRTSALRTAVYNLESENSTLEVRLELMREEYESLKENVAHKQGSVLEQEETQSAHTNQKEEEEREQKNKKAESFENFLIRKGYLDTERLHKAIEYKRKNESDVPVVELLVMFDYISSSDMAKAQREYDGRTNE